MDTVLVALTLHLCGPILCHLKIGSCCLYMCGWRKEGGGRGRERGQGRGEEGKRGACVCQREREKEREDLKQSTTTV